MMDLRKITYKAGSEKKPAVLTVRWQDGDDEHEIVSPDPPRPALRRALDAFKPVACELAMIPAPEDELWLQTVALRKDDDGNRGMTITMLRNLDWISTPLVVNTPYASLTMIPRDDLAELLFALAEEAEAYVEGKRAQADLFGDGAEMCERSGIDSITISAPGSEDVTITRDGVQRAKTMGRS